MGEALAGRFNGEEDDGPRDGRVELDRIVLRKWDPKKDKREKGDRSKRPVFVIQNYHTRGIHTRGASYAYTEIEAASVFMQEIANRHRTRIQLICDYDEVGEDLYYTADFAVDHHNTYIDAIDPVKDDNPFKPFGPIGGTIPQRIPSLKSVEEVAEYDRKRFSDDEEDDE